MLVDVATCKKMPNPKLLLPSLFVCDIAALPLADTVKTSADAAAREQLAKVVEVLVRDKVSSFEDCVAWGRLKFQVRLGAYKCRQTPP
jgi:hypothetical protein